MIRNKKHKDFGRFYRIWKGIRSRCGKHKNYENVELCEEWEDFHGFYKDMYVEYINHVKKYGEIETEIDRVDFKGNYSKYNCRWVTNREQAENRSYNRNYSYKGKTQSMAAWATELGINYDMLRGRLLRKNPPMTFKEAVTTPKLKEKRVVEQYSLPGMKLIRVWNSIKEASLATKTLETGILRCAQGKHAHSGGYYWKYVNKMELKRDIELINSIK